MRREGKPIALPCERPLRNDVAARNEISSTWLVRARLRAPFDPCTFAATPGIYSIRRRVLYRELRAVGTTEVKSQRGVGTRIEFAFPKDQAVYEGHAAILQSALVPAAA